MENSSCYKWSFGKGCYLKDSKKGVASQISDEVFNIACEDEDSITENQNTLRISHGILKLQKRDITSRF